MRTVPLHGRKANGRVTFVDDRDYDLVMQYRWHIYETVSAPGRRPSGPYALASVKRNGKSTTVSMHHLLTGWPLTDHADHDGLNNQRYNLRPASRAQNSRNRRSTVSMPDKTSSFKGVTWNKKSRKWAVRIAVDCRQRNLGFYVRETDAARAYDAAARSLHADYACLNFPDEDLQPAEAAASPRDRADVADSVVVGMRNSGCSFRDIARSVGMSVSGVSERYYRVVGVSRPGLYRSDVSDALIVELRDAQCLSFVEIAQRLDITDGAVRLRYYTTTGRSPKKAVGDTFDRLIVELRDRGALWREIADQVGMSQSGVRKRYAIATRSDERAA